MQAKFFPLTILIPMLLIGTLNVALEWMRGHARESPSSATSVDVKSNLGIDNAIVRRRTITIFFWIVGFLIGIWLLGFSLSIPLFVFLYLRVYSKEGWALSLILASAAWLLFFGLFDRLLHLPFPEGILFSLL